MLKMMTVSVGGTLLHAASAKVQKAVKAMRLGVQQGRSRWSGGRVSGSILWMTRDAARKTLLSLAFLAGVTALPFRPILSAGLDTHLPVAGNASGSGIPSLVSDNYNRLVELDTKLHFFLVTRNVERIKTDPRRVFETGHCAPTSTPLALGEPVLTLSAIAALVSVLSANPVVAYNVAVYLSFLTSAVAAFLLVLSWGRSYLAGVFAGVLYGLHFTKIGTVSYPFVADSAWCMLALYFFQAWIGSGAWRHVFAVGLFSSFQVGASFYPMIASGFIIPPLAIDAMWRRGVGRTKASQWGVFAALLLAAAFLVYQPYLEMRSEGLLESQRTQFFATYSHVLPGGRRFPGWPILALCALALLPGYRRLSDAPVVGLIVGSVSVLLVCTTHDQFVAPRTFDSLAAVVPGLDSVRRPNEIMMGFHLGTSLLAGIGVARVLWWRPQLQAVFAFLLPIATYLTLHPLATGGAAPVSYGTLYAAENKRELELLEATGPGPIFELGLDPIVDPLYLRTGDRLLSAAHHGRETSACYSSNIPASNGNLALAARDLLRPQVLDRLVGHGFRTILFTHHDGPHMHSLRAAMIAESDRQGAVRLIADTPSMSFWRLSERGAS